MFDTAQRTIDHQRERERFDVEREVRSNLEQQARLAQRLTEITRLADERGYWKAAGCSSPAQWLAQISSSDYRTAARIVEVGNALRELPALDQALKTGDLTLDQVAAATPCATRETDAELARVAVGMAPSQIARVARTLSPPTATDDATLRKRRALSMRWIEGDRELIISGRLPLEQGVAFEQAIRNAAKAQRARDKKTGSETLDWQQSTADALVTLTTNSSGTDETGHAGEGSSKRSRTTLIVHLSPDEPPTLEGAGPISPETAAYLTCDARRLTIKRHGRDLLHSRVGRCASYAQMRALIARDLHCRYPGCNGTHELEAHHILAVSFGGFTVLENLLLLCSRHHKHLHDRHIHTTGTPEKPVFTDAAGRTITARPRAPRV
jgi:hypothetical protein